MTKPETAGHRLIANTAAFGCALLALPVGVALSPLIVPWLIWDRHREGTLRRRIIARYGPQCRGILVYSNSPNWQEYIEAHWLPRIGDRLAILNWSERSTWHERYPLEAMLVKSLGDREFNPAAIILTSQPIASLLASWWHALLHLDAVRILVPRAPSKDVVRFFQAFRDYKHGKHHTLRAAEDRMWLLLDGPANSGA